MKIFKSLLIALAVIVIVSLVGIYLLPNAYSVSESIEINKHVEVVYAEVMDYSKWNVWDPWKETDPQSKQTYEGTPGQPGHKMTWSGEKIGEGSITIKDAQENESINARLEFTEPFTATAKDHWLFENAGEKTKVTWISEGGLKFPVMRVMGSKIEEELRAQKKHGLENLKKVCEAMQEETQTASVTDTVVVQ